MSHQAEQYEESRKVPSISTEKTGRIIFLGLLGAAAIWYTVSAYGELDMTVLGHIGPAVFPIVIGACIALTCLFGVIGELRHGRSGENVWPEGASLKKTSVFVVLLAVNVFGIYVLGIFLSSVIASLLAARLIARVSWIKAAIFSVVFSLVVNWFFGNVLNSFLPQGILSGII